MNLLSKEPGRLTFSLLYNLEYNIQRKRVYCIGFLYYLNLNLYNKLYINIVFIYYILCIYMYYYVCNIMYYIEAYTYSQKLRVLIPTTPTTYSYVSFCIYPPIFDPAVV